MGFLNVILFLISLAFVSCKEHVPVLVWSTQTTADSYPLISALTKLTTDDFTDYLLKRVKVEKPTILVFVEENLSVEDFSWRDVNENSAFPSLSNISKLADDVAFLPSVQDPYKALRQLSHHGYTWKHYNGDEGFGSLKNDDSYIFEVTLTDPDFLEDRPDMLRRHDEQMAKIYNEALEHHPNVMVVYTGNHTSWTETEIGRFKRDEKDSNYTTTIIISDANNVVRMSVTSPMTYLNGSTSSTMIIKGDPTTNENANGVVLRVKFSIEDKIASFNFNFSTGSDGWWSLNFVDIQEFKQTGLKPNFPVGALSNYSYFCNPAVVFSNGNVSFTFKDFQVQPKLGSTTFGPVIHCIPFFSIGILSGLLVVFILSVVLAWGIVMIMDINTNDRFDDPKGKTITITATD